MSTLIVGALLLSGCAAAPEKQGGVSDFPSASTGEFRVPDIRLGDVYRYAFSFKGPNIEAGGVTDVSILERAPVHDARGVERDAVRVLQSSPDGSFQETYWIDAETLTQFKIENRANYSEASHFPAGPFGAAPVKHASYGNGTGTRERFHEDPVFEDYSFFGAFASGRLVPPVGGELSIPAMFWLRDDPTLLARYDNLTGKVDKEALDETWGTMRHVAFRVDWRAGDDFETIAWDGSFSSVVPFAVEAKRILKAKIGTRDIDVTFNITLQAFQPGEGEPLPRRAAPERPPRRAVEFAAWERAPADGSGAKLFFPLSEALVALDKDPTAIQFFQQHPGSYLYVAHMDETDTCGFYAQPAPGCHWFDWEGRLVAPDDWQLDFIVHKFADANGGGAPAFVPPVSRDYPFEVLFGLGGTPQPPEPAVVASKGTRDWGPRSGLAPDALTMAGAIAAFKASAWANLSALDPNVAVVFLDAASYSYYLSKEDWVFPKDNPELVFFYDDGPLVLERHTAEITSAGDVMVSHNFWHQVVQR